MCALSNHIREKPNWWEEVKDEVIVEKWREEALRREEEALEREEEALRREKEALRRENEALERGEEVLEREEEALQLELPWRKLTPTMVKSRYLQTSPPQRPHPDIQVSYALEELHGYASLRDPETGVEVRFTPAGYHASNLRT